MAGLSVSCVQEENLIEPARTGVKKDRCCYKNSRLLKEIGNLTIKVKATNS
ncbi:hypothetical protein [Dulcicalothrix desertica]|uniref:hypothetical protein n=1 Tax=Dulcicalothrix desertica TaxID=32056 RepID=UPI0016492709|nr:hypothetical protein [Dulcicalothrix desertica]